MNSNSTGNNLPSINMISEGTHLKGNLTTKNDIRIAGSLEGEAKAKGKLIISSTGKINGDVHAVDADVAGRLQGEIRVSNKLILRQSAIIDGDIHTKSLLVEEGAQINGACRMGESVGPSPSTSKEKKKEEEEKEQEEMSDSRIKPSEPQKVE